MDDERDVSQVPDHEIHTVTAAVKKAPRLDIAFSVCLSVIYRFYNLIAPFVQLWSLSCLGDAALGAAPAGHQTLPKLP